MSFRVVILTNKVTSLRQSEQYLRNRQWDIYSTPNLREAIAAIIQRRPDFVLIAADHPNKKVRTLPKLINQAMQVNFIAFVEGSTTSSMAALNELKTDYTIFPPISGPAIERTILKAKKEIDAKAEQEARGYTNEPTIHLDNQNNSAKTNESNSGIISIGGSSPADKRADVRDDFANFLDQDANNKPGSNIAYMPSGNSGNIAYMPTGGPSESSDEKQRQGYFPPPESHANANGSAAPAEAKGYVGGMGNSHDPGGEHGGAHVKGEGSTYGYQARKPRHYSENQSSDSYGPNDPNNSSWVPNGPKNAKQNQIPTFEAPDAPTNGQNHPGDYTPPEMQTRKSNGEFDPYASDWQGDDPGSGNFSGDPNSPQRNADSATNNPQGGSASTFEGMIGEPKKDGVPILEHDPINLRKGKGKVTYKQDPAHYRDNDSIIVKGTQQALDEASVAIGSGETYEQIEKATNVACIVIDSQKFSGYLVAAMGKDRKIDTQFMNTVKQKLFDFLRSHGEVVKDDNSMDLNLQQVEFEDWAIQQADFLRKSVHGTSEVAMAFFPSKETNSRLEDSVTDNMLKMSLDELRDDVPVEFDCYIYMPTNNRFLLYTAEGRPIYGNQRGRLREKGVTHLHLRKESAGQVKKYRAQCFLNERISEFRNKTAAKAS